MVWQYADIPCNSLIIFPYVSKYIFLEPGHAFVPNTFCMLYFLLNEITITLLHNQFIDFGFIFGN